MTVLIARCSEHGFNFGAKRVSVLGRPMFDGASVCVRCAKTVEFVPMVPVGEVVKALREQVKWYREGGSQAHADVIEFTVLPLVESRFGAAEGER